MQFEAAKQRVEALERVVVDRPAVITEHYEQFARALGLAVLLPGSLMILIGLFIVPFGIGTLGAILASSFLHILLLLGLLGIVNALEKPVSRLLLWGIWPAHRWWLIRQAPELLPTRVLREHQWHLAPSSVDFDEHTGVLRAGVQAALDLSQPFEITLERSESPSQQIRVRLSSTRTGKVSVVCAEMPLDVIWRWGERWRALPRIDGESVVVSWGELKRLVGAVRPFGDACGIVWPTMLSAPHGSALSDRRGSRAG